MNLVIKCLILITSLWIVLFILFFSDNQIFPINILFDVFLLRNDYASKNIYIELLLSGTNKSYFELYFLIVRLVNSIFLNHIMEIFLIVFIYIFLFHKLGFINSIIHKISIYFGFGIQETETKKILLHEKKFQRMSRCNNLTIIESDEEPPALETSCKYRIENIESNASLTSYLGNTTTTVETDPPHDWYVFDPVYGVIPQETRDLWNKHKITQRNTSSSKKNIPPIRFSGGNDNNN